MKRSILAVILCFAGMAVHAQDMSYYTREFKSTDSSFKERLTLLETVRDAGLSGLGEFYHEALKHFLLKFPDIRTNDEWTDAENSARILCNGLGEEKYTAAAPALWETADIYDVGRPRFDRGKIDGLIMQDALIALGNVDGKDFSPHIIERLSRFNSQTFTDQETRRFAQRGVVGCVKALEAMGDPAGYRPVFFVYVGSYDPAIRLDIAYNALPSILDDPGEVISEIIIDPSSDPRIKLEAWKEMLKSKASGSSKAKTASVALATSFVYNTSNRVFQTNLKDMRKSAIDTIRENGVPDDSVYPNIEKAYNTAFTTASPDYEEIQKILDALRTIKSEEAVGLLLKFLQELHGRRRSNTWGTMERNVFERVVYAIGATGTQDINVRLLLTNIRGSSNYTSAEQRMAANALTALGVTR